MIGVLQGPVNPPGTPRRRFAELAGDCQVTLSTGRKGQCWDNAVAESFSASLKGELIETRALAHPGRRLPGGRGIHRLVQRHRLHSTLDCRSPADYENDHYQTTKNAI
jgi:putative transposase